MTTVKYREQTINGATIACGLPLNYSSLNHVVELIPHLVGDI